MHRRPKDDTVRAARWAWLCLGLLTGLSGCNSVLTPVAFLSAPARGIADQWAYNEDVDELVLGWRNRVWADQAWSARRAQFATHPQLYDFGLGFKQGYKDVAAGGNGCPPLIVPRRYWSWRYQTAEGQAKSAAWLEGYPYGAQAADEDGAANWSQIQTSYRFKAQYHRDGPMLVQPPAPPRSPETIGPPLPIPTGPPIEMLPQTQAEPELSPQPPIPVVSPPVVRQSAPPELSFEPLNVTPEERPVQVERPSVEEPREPVSSVQNSPTPGPGSSLEVPQPLERPVPPTVDNASTRAPANPQSADPVVLQATPPAALQWAPPPVPQPAPSTIPQPAPAETQRQPAPEAVDEQNSAAAAHVAEAHVLVSDTNRRPINLSATLPNRGFDFAVRRRPAPQVETSKEP